MAQQEYDDNYDYGYWPEEDLSEGAYDPGLYVNDPYNPDRFAPTPSGHATEDAYYVGDPRFDPPQPPGTPVPTPGPTPVPTPVPTPSPRQGGSGGGGSSFDMGPLLQPYPGVFTKPQFGEAYKQLADLLGPAPEFQAPAVPTVDPFTYDPYTPTTGADVFSDPSFEFRKGIGEKALLNSKAAQGLTRSGGTLKDLLDYNQNFATQDFSNVDARRSKDYGMNRTNAFENWNANKGTKLDLYDRGFDAKRAEYEPKLYEWTQKGQMGQRAEERASDDAFRNFQQDYNMWRNQGNDVFDRLKWSSEFGLDAATR